MKKFNQDLVFCRAPDDNELTSYVHGMVLVYNLIYLNMSDPQVKELWLLDVNTCLDTSEFGELKLLS